MADFKLFKPFTVWFSIQGGYKIRLSHEEIETISSASSPIAALTSLVPTVGPFIATAVSVWMWLVRQVDKTNGSRGVVIFVGFGSVAPIVRKPETWYD